ncbi:hypothetical protein EP10_002338 [Geobacillus icigianus]|uniref:Uncharacterized protein n=1 Tax=Geobacillus icigianus TaxID=1430331 RepID=A0ABU6BHR4_9BACL|nr:hypothetical protein [Geobacillus icigianus]
MNVLKKPYRLTKRKPQTVINASRLGFVQE